MAKGLHIEVGLDWEIRGKAFERSATVLVDDQRVSWKGHQGRVHPTPVECGIPLGELTMFSTREVRWTGASTFGAALVALAISWTLFGAVDVWIGAVLVALGGLVILLRRRFPATILTVRGRDQLLVLEVASRSKPAARSACAALQRNRPELAGVPPTGLIEGILLPLSRSLAVLASGAQPLREEYRRKAGNGASPEQEARYVRASKRIAWWNVLWGLVAPLVIALVVQPLLPEQPPWGLVLRIAIWFAATHLLLLYVQSRLLFLLKRIAEK